MKGKRVIRRAFYGAGWFLQIFAGLGLSFYGLSLGLSRSGAPGPGVWPLVVGGGLLLLGFLSFWAGPDLAERGSSWQILPSPRLARLAFAFLFWLLFLNTLGWPVVTAVAMYAVGREGERSLSPLFALIVGTLFALHLGLDVLMHQPLPSGSLWRAL